MTSSPISDLNPILMAANTQLHVRSHSKGCRTITMGDDFFTGYRQNIIGSEETLISIEIPFTSTVNIIAKTHLIYININFFIAESIFYIVQTI